MIQPYLQIHKTSIKILNVIKMAGIQIKVENQTLRDINGTFLRLEKKVKHNKVILGMAITRLWERHDIQRKKISLTYYDEEGIYNECVDRLDFHPGVDSTHDVALQMDFEYDEDLGFYFEPH